MQRGQSVQLLNVKLLVRHVTVLCLQNVQIYISLSVAMFLHLLKLK